MADDPVEGDIEYEAPVDAGVTDISDDTDMDDDQGQE